MNSYVSLIIYDMVGREIASLVNEQQFAGWKEVHWNALGFANGIYFCRLEAGNYFPTKKLVLLASAGYLIRGLVALTGASG